MNEHEIYPQEAEELCRSMGIERSISKEQRDSIPDEDFALPFEHKFPINSQDHLDAAAKLLGHTPESEQSEIKKHAIEIAKRKGLILPDSWQGDDKPDDDDTQDRAIETPTEMPVATLPAVVVGTTPENLSISMPLVRIDATKRMVWGQATAEIPDSYGTIFGYYPDAWKQWRGNIREQHDPKKAVGKRVDLECNDLERAVYVGSRVSRGAQDTWMKIEDDVLSGYSVSIIPDAEFGRDPAGWPKKEYNGKQYPYLPRYSIAELSLVDSPACPGCEIQIIRADGIATDVIDVSDPDPEPEPAPKKETLDRAGTRLSAGTKDKMHSSIKHTIHAAVSQMNNCGCDICAAAMKMIDPDCDGDIDLGGYDDPDGDAARLYANNNSSQDMERTITTVVERVLQPVFARLNGIAGVLSRSTANTKPLDIEATFETLLTGAITRAVDAAQVANESNLSEVRASLETVREQVDAIANTPMPGAPVMNTSAIPRPTAVDKRLATDPYTMPKHSGSAVADAVAAMSAAGQLDTTEKQVNAVAAALAAQRRG